MERGKKIDPVVKGWLDKVLIPVMVREYLAICRTEGDNGLSPIDSATSKQEPVQ